MDHPNIAGIYDGGVTPSSQPFFVMELVKALEKDRIRRYDTANGIAANILRNLADEVNRRNDGRAFAGPFGEEGGIAEGGRRT